MISPSEPGEKGNSGCQQDDMSHEGHREQFEHANQGQKISTADRHEGSGSQTSEEKREASK